ncbi:MAG: hypothetical protein HC889_18210 [Synechococcaceae cyanobacterium SM1_2_3]|nr:hypothetical protein [Synechococcaceae cyanobacterium SM1_2_3]
MMLFIRFIVLPLWLLLGLMPALAGNGWSEVAVPLSGPPQVFGSYTSGCIAGATALPLVGNGYQVMRSSRNRYYGHPVLIALVERLGAANGGARRAVVGGRLGATSRWSDAKRSSQSSKWIRCGYLVSATAAATGFILG